jgi:membrane carboxypeptidase/penicillin-binding protein PbpC
MITAGNCWALSIASDGQWRFPYNADVPPKFKACIMAFEDKRFEHHPGLIFGLWSSGAAKHPGQACGERGQYA